MFEKIQKKSEKNNELIWFEYRITSNKTLSAFVFLNVVRVTHKVWNQYDGFHQDSFPLSIQNQINAPSPK